MNLTKEMIEQSFTTAMILLYDTYIDSGSKADEDTSSSAVTPQDITSMFTKEEFQELAEPHLQLLPQYPDDQVINGLKIDIAYNFVLIEYANMESDKAA